MSGLWSNRDFMRLWAAQAVSAFGSRITRVALPIIAVATLHESEGMVALLTSVSLAPAAILAMLAGGLVDRGKKRRILIISDLTRALAIGSLTLAWALHVLSIVHVFVVGAVVGAATALFQIADVAYLPAIVQRGELVDGNSKLQTTEAIAEITGPASAGVLIAALGAPIAVVIDAASYLWSALVLGRIKAIEPPPSLDSMGSLSMSISASMWQTTKDLRIGLRAVFRDPLVRPIVISLIIWTASYGFFAALYTLFCLRTLHLGQATFGVIIAMGGVGSILGAMLAKPAARRFGVGPTLLGSAVIVSLSGLLIPFASGAAAIALLVAQQLIGDGLSVVFNIHAVTLRQTVLRREVLGRANAAITACVTGVVPFAAVAAGAIAELSSVRVAIAVGMAIPLCIPIVLYKLRHVKQLPSHELLHRGADQTIR